MRGFGAVVAVAIVAVMLVAAAVFISTVPGKQATGFEPSDLATPTIEYLQYVGGAAPTPHISHMPEYSVSMSWQITEEIYAGYGGALNLTVENTAATGSLYVYAFGLEWSNGLTTERNCSVTINHGSEAEVGLLIFTAPQASSSSYRIYIKIAASNALSTGWYDLGIKDGDWYSVSLLSLASDTGYTVTENPQSYYNRVNELIDQSAVADIVSLIKEKYPGDYNILQIAEAYTWMTKHIAYVSDGPNDYWQSASETLARGTGDCEDHAILIASIIGALGGNARVNIIEDHAFPTVFVASDASELVEVKAAMASYYGIEVSQYKMAYLQDDNGYWLVIDPTGYPYAGGIPAKSSPTSVGGNWTVLSSYLYTVDATGVTDDGGIFGIF